MAYYGWPGELPEASKIDEILSQANEELTDAAREQAMQRPEPWDVADNLLEFGIALAGVVGGVYGAKALNVLQIAKQKSVALREVISGNELFKKQNAESVDQFNILRILLYVLRRAQSQEGDDVLHRVDIAAVKPGSYLSLGRNLQRARREAPVFPLPLTADDHLAAHDPVALSLYPRRRDEQQNGQRDSRLLHVFNLFNKPER